MIENLVRLKWPIIARWRGEHRRRVMYRRVVAMHPTVEPIDKGLNGESGPGARGS